MAVKLHVLYAGRGDSMIMEDGDKLYVIDGGPLTRNVYSRSNSAPYYEYLTSMLVKVSLSMGRPAGSYKPDAIIVSHRHDDHFGGIVKMLDTYLADQATNAASQANQLVFNGPFLVPARIQISQDDIDRMLKKKHFTSSVVAAPQLAGFVLESTEDIMTYNRVVSPLLQVDWGVDSSKENAASILMYHSSSKMVFTGDGIGYLIKPFIDKVVAAGDVVSIFKVPHHGSRRNSQLLNPNIPAVVPKPAVSDLAWQEYGMLMILDYHYNKIIYHFPDDELYTSPAAEAGLEAAANYLITLLNGDVNAKAYLEDLHASFASIELQLKNGTAVQANPLAPASPNSLTNWISLSKYMSALDLAAYKGRTSQKRKKIGIDFTKENLSDYYLGLIWLRRITDFYSSFSADNYVISANYTHRHPSAETIVAIAQAAIAANRSVRIYVTSGYSVDLSAASIWTDFDLWAGKVEIWCLSQGMALSLDPSNRQNPLLNASDATKVELDEANTCLLKKIHAALEYDTGVTIPFRSQATRKYSISSSNGMYLTFDDNNAVTLTDVLVAYEVVEGWLDGRDSFNDIIIKSDDITKIATIFLDNMDNGQYKLQLYVNGAPGPYLSLINSDGYRTNDPAEAALFTFAPFAGLTTNAVLLNDSPQDGVPSPLRDYLTVLGLPASTASVDGLTVLRYLAGPDNTVEVQQQSKLQVFLTLMGWNVDFTSSTVTLSGSGVTAVPSESSISLQIGDGHTVTVNNQTVNITTVTITLSWSDKLTVKVMAETDGQFSLYECVNIVTQGHSVTLDRYLYEIGLTDATKWSMLTIGSLLTYMLDSQALVESLLIKTPFALLAQNLSQWTLDHANSQVETVLTVIGTVEVVSAKLVIVPQMPSISMNFLSDLTGTFTSVSFTIDDARLDSMIATLQATVTIRNQALTASIILTDEKPELVLQLEGSAVTAAELLELLPGSPDLSALPVPGLPAATTFSQVTLSSPGMSFLQVVEGTSSYQLSSVFFTAQLDGWSSLLPSQLVGTAGASVSLRVFNPLEPELRRIGFDVLLAVPVGTTSPATLNATLSVQPLPNVGDFACTLGVETDAVGGVSLSEAMQAVGLSYFSDIATQIPLLSNIVNDVKLTYASLVLDKLPSGVTCTEFDIAFAVPGKWTIVDQLLDIYGAEVSLSYFLGEWSGSISSAVVLDGQYLVDIMYKLPTLEIPGTLSISNPNPDLTIAKFIQLLGLGDLTQLPIVGSMLAVQIAEVELTIACEPSQASGTSLRVTEAKLQFNMDTLDLGLFQLSSLSLILDSKWVVAAPNGSEGGPGGSWQTGFAIEAFMGSTSTKMISLSYDPKLSQLSASFRALEAETFGSLLNEWFQSGLPSTLLGFIGTMGIDVGTFILNTTTYALQSFQVTLTSSAQLPFGSVQLESLTVDYATTASGTNSYSLLGKLQGNGTDALVTLSFHDGTVTTIDVAIVSDPLSTSTGFTITGLLGLFGITPQLILPSGFPNFLSLQITQASASMTIVNNTFTLNNLQVTVQTQSTYTLLSAPNLELTAFKMDYSYDKNATVPSSYTVYGQLMLLTGLQPIWLGYTSTAGADLFRADLTGMDEAQFASALTQYAPSDQFALPADPNFPASVPMSSLSVAIRPGVSFELSGYADTTEYSFICADLTLSITKLGGRIYIVKDAQGLNAYSCALTGGLSINGLVSTSVTLRLNKDSRILTAIATTDSVPQIQLSGWADQINQTDASAWSDVLPSGTSSLQLSNSAYLYADLTPNANVVALMGSLRGFGQGVLVSKYISSTSKWSYGFAFSMSPSFTFAQLNSSLAVIDTYISVAAADAVLMAYDGTWADFQALFTSISTYAAQDQVQLTMPFSDVTLGSDAVMPKGMSLYAKLNLGGEPLTANLGSMSDGGQTSTPAIILSALLDHSNPSNSAFSGQISQFALLGGKVILNGTATYMPNDSAKLSVVATVDVNLTDTNTYAFAGQFDLTDTSANLMLGMSGTNPVIDQPFGGMFSVQLKTPQLQAQFQFTTDSSGQKHTTSSYVISGKVAFTVGSSAGGSGSGGGSSSSLELDALIGFVGGVPKVAIVQFQTHSLSITDLFSSIISGGSISTSFPSGYELFSLDSATLYYADGNQSVLLNNVTYEPGYYVAANVTFLTMPFIVSVHLPPERTGIELSGTYNGEIDFIFAQLTGYTDATGVQQPGPTVSISTVSSTKVYAFAAGLKLFQHPFAQFTLAYQPDQQLYTGTVQLEDETLGNPEIGLSYSNHTQKLRITSWPTVLEDLIEAARFVQMLQNASSSGCGALVDLAFSDTITTLLTTQLTTDDTVVFTDGKLHLLLNGAYTISINATQLDVSFPLPPIPIVIDIPTSFSMSEVLGKITESILDSLVAIGQSFWSNKEKAALFFGAIAVKQLSKQALSYLLCSNIKPENVLDEVEARVNEDYQPENPGEESPMDSATGATSSTFASTMNAASLGDLAGALAAFLPAVGLLLGLLNDLLDWINDLLSSIMPSWLTAKKDDAEARQNDANDKRNQVANRIKGILHIQVAPSVSVSGSTLQVNWSKPQNPSFDYGDYAGIGYRLQISNSVDFNNVLEEKVCSDSSELTYAYTDNNVLYSRDLYVRVVARYVVAQSFPYDAVTYEGDWTDSGHVTHIPQLPGSASISQTYVSQQELLTVTFDSVVGANMYRIDLIDRDNTNTVLTTVNVQANSDSQLTYSFTTSSMEATAAIVAILARVKATADQYTDSVYTNAPTASGTPVQLPPQPLFTGRVSSSSIIIDWPAVTGQVAYEINVSGVSGALPATNISLSGTEATINGAVLNDPLHVQVRVLPNAAGQTISLWSASIEMLPAPEQITWTYICDANPRIEGSWTAVTTASSYVVEVVDKDSGQPLSPLPVVQITGVSASITGSAITSGKAYTLRVQATTSTGVPCISSDAFLVTAVQLIAPSGVSAACQSGELVCDWVSVVGADSYEVDLLSAGTVVSTKRVQLSPASFGADDHFILTPQWAYSVQVRAHTATTEGPIASAELTLATLYDIVTNLKSAGKTAAEAGTMLQHLVATVGYARMYFAFAAAGYVIADCNAVTTALYPSVTTDQLQQLVTAGTDQLQVAVLLKNNQCPAAELVDLLQALFHTSAVLLAAASKIAGITQADLQPLLMSQFPGTQTPPLADIVTALYDQPWKLGPLLQLSQVQSPEVAAKYFCQALQPLRLVKALIILKTGGYAISDVADDLRAQCVPSPDAKEFADCYMAVVANASSSDQGAALAGLLHDAGATQEEAASYMLVAYTPPLTIDEINQALQISYGGSHA